MDEQNNSFTEDFDFLKSLESDHIAEAEFTPVPGAEIERTQVFNVSDFIAPFNEAANTKELLNETDTESEATLPPQDEEEEPASEEAPAARRSERRPAPSFSIPAIDFKDPRALREVVIPGAIAAVALVLCLVFIIGSISQKVRANKEIKDASIAAASSATEESKRIDAEYGRIIVEAEEAANAYDYERAIQILDSFTGNPKDYPDISITRQKYQRALDKMTVWNDPSQVLNLSFHVLVADPARAYADEDYGYSYESNFITTDEFTRILEQLYANGYILVSFDDIVETVTNADGSTGYAARTLYLPDGKKPVMLTQTNANYYTYMIDSDGDGKADKDGAGFASRLIVDDAGLLTCEMVDANGNTVTGAFDMVPILENFIALHPDFSYRNARAIIATSGYDGVFGYRINKSAEDTLGTEEYKKEVAEAKRVAQVLKERGYVIACYTYDNIDYDFETTANIQVDLHKWQTEITPVIGDTDVLVYAWNSDIADTTPYSGDKYNALKAAGFRYYLGVGSTSKWANVNSEYVRQFRMTITGDQLVDYPEKYSDLFNATTVLDPAR